MLLKKINRAYWVIGLLLYAFFLSSSINDTKQTYFLASSFISFILFTIAILESSRRQYTFFNKTNLVVSVLLISLIQVLMFSFLSYSIDGDLFLFSKADAMVYYVNSLEMSSMKWIDSIRYVSKHYHFDDWGAFIWFSTLFRISTSLMFVKLIHVVVAIVSSLLLFDIGCYIMPRRYAYMASLTFFIASFTAVFHTVFLKESIFVFIIIAAFLAFYRFYYSRNILYLIIAFILSLTVAFFRLPVSIILFGVFVITLILIYAKGIIAIVLGVIFFAIMITSSYTAITYERYLSAGDIDYLIERKEGQAMGGGIVKHSADPLAAFMGPFPSIAIKKSTTNSLYSSGLLYRLLLAAPFFCGVYCVFRFKHKRLYPLVMFFLFNALGVAIAVKGLETRMTYPHLAMAYVVTFWWLSQYDFQRLPRRLSPIIIYGWFVLVFVLSLVWNMR